ncbi:hypothetical protein J6590_068066 [Homalodisca vitripennis]|nr:hypothetical protein J6590_068066 [Homalodisca vitripennis]
MRNPAAGYCALSHYVIWNGKLCDGSTGKTSRAHPTAIRWRQSIWEDNANKKQVSLAEETIRRLSTVNLHERHVGPTILSVCHKVASQ